MTTQTEANTRTGPAPTVRVGCPGCNAPLDVSAEPTEATWLDDEQWCADCRVEPECDVTNVTATTLASEARLW